MKIGKNGVQRITVDELDGNDAILVTISKARIQNFSQDYLRGRDEKLVLSFSEFGDAEYIVNATSFRRLADRYTNDIDNNFRAWLGKPVVLVRETTDNPQSGEKVQGVWVAAPSQWADAVRVLAADEEEVVEVEEETPGTTLSTRRVGRPPNSAKKRR